MPDSTRPALNPSASSRAAALDGGWRPSPGRRRAHRLALDNRVQHQILAPVLSVAAGYYAVLALIHPWFVPSEAAHWLSLTAAGTSVSALALRIAYARGLLPARRAYAYTLAAGTLALGNSHLHLALTQELHQTTNILILVVGAGLVLGRWRWLAAAAAIAALGWAVASWPLRGEPAWTHYALALVSALAMASIAVLGRRRVIALLSDIHLQDRQVAGELRKAYRAARESDEAKARFLATVSHELRTPVQGIMGGTALARLAAEGSAGLDVASALEMVDGSADDLVRLLDDLIEVSRVGSAEITLQREPVDLVELTRRVVETFQPRIAGKRQTLVDGLPAEPVVGNVDRVRLTQVLTKLLDNAVKFTADGGRLGIRMAATDAEVVIEVWDEGIGMAPHHVARIGEAFFQADDSLTRRYGGTGTGLALATHLIRLHGGSLEIDSAPGKGTVMRVRLPRAP